MQDRFTQDGVVYETLPNGNVRVVGYADSAASQGQGQVFTLPQDPAATARQAASDNRANAADRRAQDEADRKAREWAATHNPDGSPKPTASKNGSAELTAATRASAINAFTATRQLDNLITDIEGRFKAGPGSTKGIWGVQDWLPTPSNRQFDAAGNAVRGAAITALGFTSGQTNTPREVEQNIGPYIPAAGDYDEVITDKIARLKELRDRARVQAVTVLGGIPDASGKITPLSQLPQQDRDKLFPPGTLQPFDPGIGGAPSVPPTAPSLGGPGRLLAPDEAVQFRGDGAPVTGKRLSPQQEAEIVGAIRAGDEGQALALLGRFSGAPPGPGEAASIREAIVQTRKDPRTPVGLNYGKVDTFAQTQADRDRFGNALAPAMEERASAPGFDVSTRAGVNGITAGLADYAAAAGGMLGGGSFGDNLRRQQALSEADTRLHPDNTMISNIVGGAGGAALTEGAAAALLPVRAAAWAPRIGDAIYGAVSGATSAAPGETGGATLGGGLAGTVGGMFGRGATRGVGNVARGVREASADFLRNRGVPLTVGQMLGRSGRVGQAIKGFEDRLSGIPVIGDAVNARRLEGLEGFNRAGFDEALAPVNRTTGGTIGPEGVAAAQAGRSDAYREALDPVQMAVDQAFDVDLTGAQAAGARLPQDMAGRAAYAIDRSRENVDPNGILTGGQFQQALRRLRRTSNENAPLPNGHDLGEVMNTAEGAFTGLLDRQAPGVMQDYLAANAANRNVSILKDAVTRARNGTRSGEVGLFAPSQLNDAATANAKRFGNSAGTPDQPFYDLGRHGQRVLPNAVPDSGTAGRLATLALPGILGGAGAGLGAVGGDAGTGTTAGLGVGALLALGGTRGGQRAITALLAERPDALVRIGEQINRRARIGGMFGAPLLAGSPLFQPQ